MHSMIQDYSNEANLIKSIRKRENAAFEYIHQKCHDVVRMFIEGYSGSEEDIEDIYNEGIASLIEAIDKPDLEKNNNVINLFVVICRNNWIDVIKKRRSARIYSQSLEEDAFNENFEAQLDKVIYQNIYWNSFEKLKKDCQTIIKEFLNGVPLKDIAALLGLTPLYIKKKKFYCQKNLFELVYKHPDYKKI
jgi:RNA polymerase sigma factor (sigma-70 family)